MSRIEWVRSIFLHIAVWTQWSNDNSYISLCAALRDSVLAEVLRWKLRISTCNSDRRSILLHPEEARPQRARVAPVLCDERRMGELCNPQTRTVHPLVPQTHWHGNNNIRCIVSFCLVPYRFSRVFDHTHPRILTLARWTLNSRRLPSSSTSRSWPGSATLERSQTAQPIPYFHRRQCAYSCSVLIH